MVPRELGSTLRVVAVPVVGQHIDGQKAGQGVDPAPPVWNGGHFGAQVVHQATDRYFRGGKSALGVTFGRHQAEEPSYSARDIGTEVMTSDVR